MSNQRQILIEDQTLQDTISLLAISTLGKKWSNVKPHDPLLTTQAGFDSFSLMEFVLCLEDRFDLHIPDDALDPDIFYSIETIAAYIRTRLEQKKGGENNAPFNGQPLEHR